MVNNTLSDINQTVFVLASTVITNWVNISVSNSGKAFSVTDGSNVSIRDSLFSNLGIDSPIYGSGIHVQNSNITLVNSEFLNNSASYGGAIALLWDTNTFWQYEIADTVFDNNNASNRGGSIYYNLYRPIMQNLTFTNNYASYGPNIASYAIKIKLNNSYSDDIILENVGSGVLYDQTLDFILIDADNQTMVLDSSSQIEIKSFSSDTLVSGINAVKANQGAVSFSSLYFTSNPGDTNVEFEITSKALDTEILKLQFGADYSQAPITVSFRYCKPGEIIRNSQWDTCSPGTYSFLWNSTVCESCMNNAECLGGTEVFLDKGYWRISKNTTKTYECLVEDACKGGYVEDSEHPVEWDTGYEGILWAEWQITDTDKYESIGNFQWSKCPDQTLNAIRVWGLVILVSVFIIILVAMQIRKKEESQRSVIMRIMTNYLQVITAVLSYNISFPNVIEDIFYPAERVGSSSEPFVSFDWFITDSELTLFTPSPNYFKAFLSGILPLLSLLLTTFVWALMYVWFKKYISDLIRNIVVTNVVILFILHPTITRTFLTVFQCIEIDEGDSRVRIDLSMKWYSNEHLAWCALVAIPSIVIWSIGIPLAAFFVLFKNRHKLESYEIRRYYLMIYQGLEPKRFYWEFINTFRKVTILSINIFLSTVSVYYRLLFIIVVLLVIYRVQVYLKPYKVLMNNSLERLELVAGTLTLFGGILFIDDENVPLINIIVFFLILIVNFRFVLNWVYAMMLTFQEKHR